MLEKNLNAVKEDNNKIQIEMIKEFEKEKF